jgi:hypothetical protein
VGQVLAAQDGLIAVDWRLDGAVLRLRANLGPAPAAGPPPAAGRVLHATAGAASELLPPFAVRVSLEAKA